MNGGSWDYDSGTVSIRETTPEFCDRIRTQIKARGLPIHPSGRVESYLKTVLTYRDRSKSISRATFSDQLRRLKAEHELEHLAFASRELPALVEWDELLSQAVLGGVDGEDGKDRSPWTATHEAICAALLIKAGFRTERAEPDLITETTKGRLGIACKRVFSKTPKQLSRRIREGIDQIERSRLQGIVWVDVTYRSWLRYGQHGLSPVADEAIALDIAIAVERALKYYSSPTTLYLGTQYIANLIGFNRLGSGCAVTQQRLVGGFFPSLLVKHWQRAPANEVYLRLRGISPFPITTTPPPPPTPHPRAPAP